MTTKKPWTATRRRWARGTSKCFPARKTKWTGSCRETTLVPVLLTSHAASSVFAVCRSAARRRTFAFSSKVPAAAACSSPKTRPVFSLLVSLLHLFSCLRLLRLLRRRRSLTSAGMRLTSPPVDVSSLFSRPVLCSVTAHAFLSVIFGVLQCVFLFTNEKGWKLLETGSFCPWIMQTDRLGRHLSSSRRGMWQKRLWEGTRKRSGTGRHSFLHRLLPSSPANDRHCSPTCRWPIPRFS